jgi:hypothetical protein
MSYIMQYPGLFLYILGVASQLGIISGPPFAAPRSADDVLKEFLQHYMHKPLSERDKTTRFISAMVNLDDTGTQETVVYLIGGGWCGSGGCTTLILRPQGTSYEVVSELTVVQLPIRVLATKSHGWHDISVHVRGGGIIEAYDAVLRFDGNSYPTNPTVYPARRAHGREAGKIVIPDDFSKATSLFP